MRVTNTSRLLVGYVASSLARLTGKFSTAEALITLGCDSPTTITYVAFNCSSFNRQFPEAFALITFDLQ